MRDSCESGERQWLAQLAELVCDPVTAPGCVAALCAVAVSAGCFTNQANHSSPNSPPPTDAAGLTALIRRGDSSVSSAHFTLNLKAENQIITAVGDPKFAGGKTQALDLSEEVEPGGKQRLIVVDQSTYVQPPAYLNHTGKSWILVTPDSRDPLVRDTAASMEQTRSSASLDEFTTLTAAARSVTLVGRESLNGAPVNHYSIEVDVAKIVPDAQVQSLHAAGVTTLPVELYVDNEGRPVRLIEDFTVQGQRISTVFTLSNFNAPVSISAPPVDQVATP